MADQILPVSDFFNIKNSDLNVTQPPCQDALGSSFLLIGSRKNVLVSLVDNYSKPTEVRSGTCQPAHLMETGRVKNICYTIF